MEVRERLGVCRLCERNRGTEWVCVCILCERKRGDWMCVSVSYVIGRERGIECVGMRISM